MDKILPPLTPEFNVRDLQRSLDFYLNILGFEIAFERPEQRFAVVRLGDAYIMLDEMTKFHEPTEQEFVEERAWRTGELCYPYGRGVNFLFTNVDVDVLHNRLCEARYPIKMPMETQSYRVNNKNVKVQQFMVMDPDGFLLRFDKDISAE